MGGEGLGDVGDVAVEGRVSGSDPRRIGLVGVEFSVEVDGGSSEFLLESERGTPSENSVMAPIKSVWIVSSHCMNCAAAASFPGGGSDVVSLTSTALGLFELPIAS